MIESFAAHRRFIAILSIAGIAWGCADVVEPAAVASVEVTSPCWRSWACSSTVSNDY